MNVIIILISLFVIIVFMSISSIRVLQRRDKDLTSLYLTISLFILMILNMLNLHLTLNN